MCEIIDKIVVEEVEKAVKEVKKSAEMDTERAEKRGEARGMVMTLKMLNYQTEDIVIQLINNFHLTKEEAVKYL